MTEELILKLLDAIKSNDLDYIHSLIATKKTDWLLTPLTNNLCAIHFAASEGKHEIVELILGQHPELVDFFVKTNNELRTPIYLATENGHHETVHCLIKYGADINQSVDKAQSHLIHFASLNGHLDLAQLLVNKNPKCIEFIDKNNQTPLILAAMKGHTDLVRYLLSKGADFKVSNRKDNGQSITALQWALEGNHFEAANCLILKITNGEEDKIIPMIKNGEQALELMLEKPELIKALLKTSRISKLINEKEAVNTTIQPMFWYRPGRNRRLSFLASIDKLEESRTQFFPVKELACGKFGSVRLFEDAEGKKIAVKSPVKDFINCEDNIINILHYRMEREAKFNQLAYPDKTLRLFKFCYQENNDAIYTNRLVMPFVDGKEADLVLRKINCKYQLARLILKIAKELNRLHSLGIVHGDFHRRNILIGMVDGKHFIRIVDFGRSYFIYEESINLMTLTDKGMCWYPPEFFQNQQQKTVIKPAPNQDVYSLGYFLKNLLIVHPLGQELVETYCSIGEFYENAQHCSPQKRPSLKSFCEELTKKLNIYFEQNFKKQANFCSG